MYVSALLMCNLALKLIHLKCIDFNAIFYKLSNAHSKVSQHL